MCELRPDIVVPIELDVTAYNQFPEVVESVAEVVGSNEGLNLLINNAGVGSAFLKELNHMPIFN